MNDIEKKLYQFINKNNFELFESLYIDNFEFIRPGTLLCLSVTKFDTRFTEFLILHGAPIELICDSCTKDSQEKPIFLAIHANSLSNLKMLIKHGCNINSISSDGYTPLHKCVKQNAHIMADILLKSGANPNIPNDILYNKFPICTAVHNNNYGILKMLLESGANPQYNCFYSLDILSREYIDYKILLLRHGALISNKRYHTRDFLEIYRNIRMKILLICISKRIYFTPNNTATLFKYLGYQWTHL